MDIHAFLQQLNGGETGTELAAALAQVAEQVKTRGKPGKVVLTISLARATQGDARLLFISPTVTPKPPPKEPKATLMYSGDGGALSRDDPLQRPLDFDNEGTPPGVTRLHNARVDKDTGEIIEGATNK